MTKNKLLKYYCNPLLIISALCFPIFIGYGVYIDDFNYYAYSIYATTAVYLLSFIPWVIVDIFNLLEWE